MQNKVFKYPQYSLHEYVNVKWSDKAELQYAMKPDTSDLLMPKETKYIQSAIGSLLYYARALDGSMLPTLSQIADTQANPTQNTKKAIHRLLDYANTYPNACFRFHVSDMELTVDSDAAYLVMPKARSRVAGYF